MNLTKEQLKLLKMSVKGIPYDYFKPTDIQLVQYMCLSAKLIRNAGDGFYKITESGKIVLKEHRDKSLSKVGNVVAIFISVCSLAVAIITLCITR